MPEHYEVKRIANYLIDNGLLHQSLKTCTFQNGGERILGEYSQSDLQHYLQGATLNNINVKAKYTIFEFDVGSVILHYRFTGIPHLSGIPYADQLYSIFSLPITSLRQDHCRFTWVFDSLTLHYYDTRCLSKLYFYPNKITCQIPLVADLPHDISSLQFLDYQTFFLLYGKRKISIKQWLLDQTTCPSGLGNYLACEVLARAKLFPFMSVSSISRDCYQNLLLALSEVDQLASSTAAYSWFHVFNREHCAICQSVIIKKKIPKYAQTTHYCSQCQVD